MTPVSTKPGTAYSRDTNPMTMVSQPSKAAWWRLLLAAIAAALVGLLGAATASATTLPEVETRVGASTVATAYVVGVHECITAGQQWDNAPPQADVTAGSCVAANSGADGVSLTLKYKDGWSAAQRAAADAKVAALNNADNLVVTRVERAGTSAGSRYRSAGGVVPGGSDVDHVIDLQLGGADDILNMNPLDMSVNRSLGAQIANQIRGLEPGTRICSVSICSR